MSNINNRDFFIDPIPESLKKNFEINQKLLSDIQPFLEQQEKLQQIFDSTNLTRFDAQIISPYLDALETINANKIIHKCDEINHMASYLNFELKQPILRTISEMNKNIIKYFNNSITTLMQNELCLLNDSISNTIATWLKSFDFSPFAKIFENFPGFDININSKKLDDIYFKAMFSARWFPYAGWNADICLMSKIMNILETSRESRNREIRINKAVFEYYTKKEIQNLKRQWRNKGLPEYMTRILVQAVQAYNRREYALTVSTLATLWEGIIQEKVNDNSYRVGNRTRANLKKLIAENKYDEIFASFCDEFIFYDCHGQEEVKTDVPGRHGIAHCWYNKYPSRKAALNAILFTDFLLELEPLDMLEEKMEEKENG